jgi:hypothetical protein
VIEVFDQERALHRLIANRTGQARGRADLEVYDEMIVSEVSLARHVYWMGEGEIVFSDGQEVRGNRFPDLESVSALQTIDV